MREYITRPRNNYEWWDIPNTESLARTVYESEELYDTGMLDQSGEKIFAKQKKQIGFVYLKERP